MAEEIKEKCKNCKYHFIEEISFDYPQSCCNKTNPCHTTEEWLKCDDFEYNKDYITNLQQDLDKANEIIEKDRQFYKCRMNEYVELKKENETLKEQIKDYYEPQLNILNGSDEK